MIRFTILTQYYPPEIGAPQVRLQAFAHELHRHGHRVHIVTAMPNYPTGTIHFDYRGKIFFQEHIDSIPIIRTWIYPATGRRVIKRLANYFSFTLSSLFALAFVPRSDVLFVESPPLFLCLSAWLIAFFRQQKLCVNISDLWPDSVVELGIMKKTSLFVQFAYALEHWLYHRAWRVCGVTKGIVEKLVSTKGMSRDKLLFLPNGVDTTLFRPMPSNDELRCQLGIDNKLVFVYAGTHGYAQGLGIIIHAAAAVQHRNDIVFLFVGEGPEKPNLKDLVRQEHLTNVLFLDAQPITMMPHIFSLVTASIVPLRNIPLFEGARPSKIFPSLACGKPVIYSGFGESVHLIEKAGCGLTVHPEDAQALAKAVMYLADNMSIAIEMGQKGRHFVEREYSWSIIVERWLKEVNL